MLCHTIVFLQVGYVRHVHLVAGKTHKMITRALKPPVFGMSLLTLNQYGAMVHESYRLNDRPNKRMTVRTAKSGISD